MSVAESLSGMPSAGCAAGVCDAVTLKLTPREKDLGGFSVRRLLPAKDCKQCGPFVFFDHAGPAAFPAGQGVDVRPHPHIGLSTVTYLYEGELLHRDSVGSVQEILPGAVNMMTAGKGITHSERTPEDARARESALHALQLWLALPEAEEEREPSFHHYPAGSLPQTDINGALVRVMIGAAFGVSSPVKTYCDTLFFEARLQRGQQITAPAACAQKTVYVVSGGLTVAGESLCAGEGALLRENADVTLEASENNTFIAVIGGEKLSARYIDWNFVSSDKRRIGQAKRDWQEGRFPGVPGETEFIPLPE